MKNTTLSHKRQKSGNVPLVLSITDITEPTKPTEFVTVTITSNVNTHFDVNTDVEVDPTDILMHPSDHEPAQYHLYVCKFTPVATGGKTQHTFRTKFHFAPSPNKKLYVVAWDASNMSLRDDRKGNSQVTDINIDY